MNVMLNVNYISIKLGGKTINREWKQEGAGSSLAEHLGFLTTQFLKSQMSDEKENSSSVTEKRGILRGLQCAADPSPPLKAFPVLHSKGSWSQEVLSCISVM